MIYVTFYLEKPIFCIELRTVEGELTMHMSGRREALFWDVLVGLRRKRSAKQSMAKIYLAPTLHQTLFKQCLVYELTSSL